MNKTITKYVILTTTILSTVFAQSGKDWTIKAKIGSRLANNYNDMRGNNNSDELSLQPGASLKVSNGDWTVKFWNWTDFNGDSSLVHLESDNGIEVAKQLNRNLTGKVMHNTYDFSNNGGHFAEVGLGLEHTIKFNEAGTKLLKIGGNWFYDYSKAGSGVFAEAYVQGVLNNSKASVAILFNDEYVIDATQFPGVRANIKHTVPFGTGYSVSADVQLFKAIGDKFKDSYSVGVTLAKEVEFK